MSLISLSICYTYSVVPRPCGHFLCLARRRDASPWFMCISAHLRRRKRNYLILYPPLSAPRISRAIQISRPRRFEAAGRRAFGSGTRCPQRVYFFRPPCAPNFRYVRCASPDYQSRSRRAPPHAELQSACGAMRPHASSRRLQQTSTSVSDVDMVATKMPAPNEVHFRPCR